MALSQRVLELERQGFIPMDGETEEHYLNRVELLSGRMGEFKEIVRQSPEELGQFFGGDISRITLHDSGEYVHLVEDAYDFMPEGYPIFMLDGPFDVWVRSSSIGKRLKIAGIRLVSKTMEDIGRLINPGGPRTIGYTGHDISIEYRDVLIPTAFLGRRGNFLDEATAAHETMHIIRITLDDRPKAYEMLFPFNIWRFAKDKNRLLEECLAYYLSSAAGKGRDLEAYLESLGCSEGASPKGREARILHANLKHYLHEKETIIVSGLCLLNGLLSWQQRPRTPGSVALGSWYMLQGSSEAAGYCDMKRSLPRIIDDMLTVEEELSERYGRKAGQAITGRLKRREMHDLVSIILDSGDASEYLANAEGLRWDIIRERYL